MTKQLALRPSCSWHMARRRVTHRLQTSRSQIEKADGVPKGSALEPISIELSHGKSKLLQPTDGEELPPLESERDYYVVRCFPTGLKRTVVEREQNILSLDEAKLHEKECNKAMLDELTR